MILKTNKLQRMLYLRQRFEKKRFKFLASFSVFLHIIGASWVLYALILKPENFHLNLNYFRIMIGLDPHKHRMNVIFKIWLLSIQLRYVLTDCYVFYNALVNRQVLLHTIQTHGLEGLICTLLFLLHGTEDCFIFGLICSGWTIMWLIAYKTIQKIPQRIQ